jgi:hypothetical protein
VRAVLLEIADEVRAEPDLWDRAALVDEFQRVTAEQTTLLRQQTCYEVLWVPGGRIIAQERGLPGWVVNRDRAISHALRYGLKYPPNGRDRDDLARATRLPRVGGVGGYLVD